MEGRPLVAVAGRPRAEDGWEDGWEDDWEDGWEDGGSAPGLSRFHL